MSVRVCCLDWSVVPGGWDGLGMTRWEQNGEMERDSERESAGAGGQGGGRSTGTAGRCPSLAPHSRSTTSLLARTSVGSKYHHIVS
jgi:hypothetical protein